MGWEGFNACFAKAKILYFFPAEPPILCGQQVEAAGDDVCVLWEWIWCPFLHRQTPAPEEMKGSGCSCTSWVTASVGFRSTVEFREPVLLSSQPFAAPLLQCWGCRCVTVAGAVSRCKFVSQSCCTRWFVTFASPEAAPLCCSSWLCPEPRLLPPPRG